VSNESTKFRPTLEFDKRWQNGLQGQDTLMDATAGANNSDHRPDPSGNGNGISKPETEPQADGSQERSKVAKDSPRAYSIEEDDDSSVRVTLNPSARIFGTSSEISTFVLAKQLADVATADAGRDVVNFRSAMATVHGIGPKDALEGLLAVQMIGVHNLAVEYLKRAACEDQTTQEVNSNLNLATKLLRTFTGQMEALNRHRGKAGPSMIVGNVSVNEGGQAIVGSVSKDGRETPSIKDDADQVK
jgi:hypothetical protein